MLPGVFDCKGCSDISSSMKFPVFPLVYEAHCQQYISQHCLPVACAVAFLLTRRECTRGLSKCLRDHLLFSAGSSKQRPSRVQSLVSSQGSMDSDHLGECQGWGQQQCAVRW